MNCTAWELFHLTVFALKYLLLKKIQILYKIHNSEQYFLVMPHICFFLNVILIRLSLQYNELLMRELICPHD